MQTIKSQRAFRLKGLICAPCTPFQSNGDIDKSKIDPYVKHLLEFGIPNVFVNGTTGEGNNMTVEERMEMAEEWVGQGRGKLSAIVIQVGGNNLRESAQLARHAEKIGADAIACVGPAFYKPQSLADYVEYMRQVATAAPNTPFMLYDIDFVTGIPYDVPSFFKAAKENIPTLFGAKHTSPNFVNINNSIEDYPEFQIVLGTDEMYLEGLVIGVDCTIMNSYLGKVLNKVRDAYLKGNIQEARKQQKYALAVGKIKRKHGLSIPQGSKLIVQLVGLNVGEPRLPVSGISQEMLQKVKEDLEKEDFFKWALE